MQPPFPCPTAHWHSDTYPTISPRRSELSAAGKTVIVTGAGGVIGRQTALAFASAGAEHIALVGRTAASLHETASLIPNVSSIHVADVSDENSMAAVASAVGSWDVLILNAAYFPNPAPLADADIADFWSGFEVNVKSVLIASKVFTPSANKDRAVVLAVLAGAISFPPRTTTGLSGYLVSKMAQSKLVEYIAAEHSNIFAACVHPGLVDSPVFRSSGALPGDVPMDSREWIPSVVIRGRHGGLTSIIAQLSAHFMVWMASREAEDLRGKVTWANWDADELRQVASRLKDGPALTTAVIGWPFGPGFV